MLYSRLCDVRLGQGAWAREGKRDYSRHLGVARLDMQNDFLAKGGYYAEKAKRVYAKGGKLSVMDRDALARVYLHPPQTCEISDGYQEFVRAVTHVADTALNRGMTTVFVQAAYDPESYYRPSSFPE